MTVLHVENLTVRIGKNGEELVKGVSFSLPERQCLGLVGESGCGKSLTCRAVTGVLAPALRASGRVVYRGKNLLGLDEQAIRKIRGNGIGLIVQNAMSAFNPLYSVGSQMIETLRTHRALGKKEARDIALAALKRMRLPEAETVMGHYPHQLSGGMAQRVMCGLTLALRPAVLIADEPTGSLDSVAQREIIEHFIELKKSGMFSMVFVSHDLSVIRQLADHVAIMRNGGVVEQGAVKDVFDRPSHFYTRSLVAAHKTLGEKYAKAMASREAV